MSMRLVRLMLAAFAEPANSVIANSALREKQF
jgi:hypothetical protein